MNKIRDNGFENSFFTQDIRDIMDIDKTKIHMLRITDYSDKDKADIFKNYMSSCDGKSSLRIVDFIEQVYRRKK